MTNLMEQFNGVEMTVKEMEESSRLHRKEAEVLGWRARVRQAEQALATDVVFQERCHQFRDGLDPQFHIRLKDLLNDSRNRVFKAKAYLADTRIAHDKHHSEWMQMTAK